MKYSLLIAALLASFLVGCGEPKPGQYPPSFMDQRESAPKWWGIGLFLKFENNLYLYINILFIMNYLTSLWMFLTWYQWVEKIFIRSFKYCGSLNTEIKIV